MERRTSDVPNPKYSQLAEEAEIENAIKALTQNGISAEVVEDGREAKKRVLEIIPAGASVMAMSSQTLKETGIAQAIEESARFESVRKKISAMGKEMTPEKRAMGAAPDWVVGSVHAVTQDGKVMIASNSGSQLPAYAYGSPQVVWVVGTQKIVKGFEEGIQRLYEYALPLEDARARQVYGMASGVNKILVVNREIAPGRIQLIFVREKLGF